MQNALGCEEHNFSFPYGTLRVPKEEKSNAKARQLLSDKRF